MDFLWVAWTVVLKVDSRAVQLEPQMALLWVDWYPPVLLGLSSLETLSVLQMVAL
jgi:hypothetical protein